MHVTPPVFIFIISPKAMVFKNSHRKSDGKGERTLKVIHSELKISYKLLGLPSSSCKLCRNEEKNSNSFHC